MALLTCFSGLGCLSQVAIVVTLVLLALKAYIKFTTGVCTSSRRLEGKTAIVTGANAGIGKETALDLACRGARVILACRSLERGNAAKDEIITRSGNLNVVVQELDLASLKSVRAFAERIIANEARLDVLINNAGVFRPPTKKTEDGLDYAMQSNHFGHFLLTNLLLGIVAGLLKKTGKARIVHVSSIASEYAEKLDFGNLNGETDPNQAKIYHTNKLCNVLFSNELARRLKGTGVTSNSLHPGVIETEIFRNEAVYLQVMGKAFLRLFFKDAKEGAQTTIHLAVATELEGVTGKYFADCKERKAAPQALDEGLAKKLWEKSEELVKLQPKERQY